MGKRGRKLELVIITGMSGSGKSKTVDVLEDLGFYCVDNMPPALISGFLEIFLESRGKTKKIAIVTDARGGELFSGLFDSLDALKLRGVEYKILFLNASDEVLIKRFKETRRAHPLSENGQYTVVEAIKKEREMLASAFEHADFIIDTSDLTPQNLKERIVSLFVESPDVFGGFVITVESFGYKYGIPLEADLVFDVRFLPNPFYEESLKEKTGFAQEVSDYVYHFDQTQVFDEKLYDLLEFLIPHYVTEGKTSLVIAIGCTGGKHRSVAISKRLYDHLKEKGHYSVLTHRDIGRE